MRRAIVRRDALKKQRTTRGFVDAGRIRNPGDSGEREEPLGDGQLPSTNRRIDAEVVDLPHRHDEAARHLHVGVAQCDLDPRSGIRQPELSRVDGCRETIGVERKKLAFLIGTVRQIFGAPPINGGV